MIYGGAAGAVSLMAFDDLSDWVALLLSSSLMGGGRASNSGEKAGKAGRGSVDGNDYTAGGQKIR